MFSDNDQVQIMLQNALQIHRIVKATFPHPWYQDFGADLDCTAPSSSKDILACAWKGVQERLQQHSSDTTKLQNTELVQELTQVS